MKKQIVKEFITIKYVRHLPKPEPPPPPPPKRRILVVGRYLLEMLFVVDKFPEENTITESNDGCWRRGGRAANICTVLRRLGEECEFLGLLSNTGTFESLLFDFQASGIMIDNCPRTALMPPIQTLVMSRENGTHTIVQHTSPHNELTFQHFLGAVDYRQYKWIHFEGRNASETYRMMRAVREYCERSGDKIVISVDLPNLMKQNIALGDMADYVFIRKEIKQRNYWMNGHESCRYIRDMLDARRERKKELQPKKNPYELADDTNDDEDKCDPKVLKPVIICADTLEGASCVNANDKYIKVAGHNPTKIVDTFGEHDTFCAAFIYAMNHCELSLRDSLEFGTRVASAKMTQVGYNVLRCIPKDLLGFYYE